MASAVQKVTLTSSQDIPFSKLKLSESNVRRTVAGVSIENLTEDIARRKRRIAHADRLARAVGLDPVQAGWSPTVDNYLGRVPKARIFEAVRQAKGEASAQLIDHLKKPDMAKEAERLLAKTGWLPEPLRTPDAEAEEAECESDAEDLPAFLEEEDEEPQEIAAE
jgi:ParB family transcriptional regulator, chromosome partitioning protein